MEGKTATSVIVSVHRGVVPIMGSSIRLFSPSRTIERPYSSNRYMQSRTAGDRAMSPPDAPPPIPFAPSAPSTTPEPYTDAPIPRALEVATLRLLLAVVLPCPRGVPIAEAPTLRLTGIVTPDRLHPLSGVQPPPTRSFLHPLSGVQPLPTRSFLRRPLAMIWIRPPTIETSLPPLQPPAHSSWRSRWLLQGSEGRRYFRPL